MQQIQLTAQYIFKFKMHHSCQQPVIPICRKQLPPIQITSTTNTIVFYWIGKCCCSKCFNLKQACHWISPSTLQFSSIAYSFSLYCCEKVTETVKLKMLHHWRVKVERKAWNLPLFLTKIMTINLSWCFGKKSFSCIFQILMDLMQQKYFCCCITVTSIQDFLISCMGGLY